MAQNNAISYDNIVAILVCMDDILSEVVSTDSDHEIRDNQESNQKSGIISDSEQSGCQMASVVSE